MLSLGIYLSLQIGGRDNAANDYEQFMRMHAMLPRQDRFQEDCTSLINIANFCISIGKYRTKDVVLKLLGSQPSKHYGNDIRYLVFPEDKWCQLLTLLPLLFNNPNASCQGMRIGTYYDDSRKIIYRPLIAIFPPTENDATLKEALGHFNWKAFRDNPIIVNKRRLTHIEMLDFVRENIGEEYINDKEEYIIDKMYEQIRQQNLRVNN